MIRFFAFLFFIVFYGLVFSQEDVEIKQVEIINANRIYHSADLPEGYNILLGEVELYHDSATMYCDSAVLIQQLKKFNAFGNVKIVKIQNNDTVILLGDTLYYDGIKKIAKVRKNVVLNKDTITLYTDSLDYDLNTDIGYYFNWGLTINGQDSLKSKYGYFFAKKDEVVFKDSAQVVNPRFKIFTPDSLKHDLARNISFFFGPTEITNDTNYLFAYYGWYNHNRNLASISKHAYFKSGEHELFADSIFYNRNSGLGQGFNNVMIIDTVNDVILKGNYGQFNEKTQHSYITDSAVFIQVYEKDSLYLHSDTIFSYIDTVYEDIDTSIFRVVIAFHKVKMYREDIQFKCDSFVYSMRDSLLMMFGTPVIWSDSSQIYANYIELYLYNGQLDEIYFYDSVFFAQKIDSVNFNQVKCKFAQGWFKDNSIKKMINLEKIQVVYFIEDEKTNEIITIATLETDTMWVYFKNKTVKMVVPLGPSEGKLNPPDNFPQNKKYLDGFQWFEAQRPKKPEDIFIW